MITTFSGTNSINTILDAVHQDNMALAVALQAEKEKVRQSYEVNLQLNKDQQALFLQLLLLNKKVQEQEEMSANFTNTFLEAVQQNEALAVALQDEKEKVWQANAVILQLKRKQQAQSLHLQQLLNEALQKQEAKSANSSENKSNITQTFSLMDSQRKKNNNENVFETSSQKGSPVCADHCPSKEQEHGGKIPRSSSRRPSDCLQERKTTNEGSVTCLKTFRASPFDFDCEEEVHVTPIKAKAEETEPVPAIGKATQLKEQVEVSLFVSKDSLSVSSSESEDNGNIPSEKQFTVFRDEESSPKVERSRKEEIPEWKSHEQERDGEEKQTDSSDYNSPLTDQTAQSVKSCKKGGLGVRPSGRGLSLCHGTNLFQKFSHGGSRPSDAHCSAPALAPIGKCSCTTPVDKEPSMNAKRGNKGIVLEFLRSVFK